jgi:hypothetical protein
MNLWILLALTAIVELYVLRRLKFDGFIVAIVLTGTLSCVDYLTYTSVLERNYDGSSQIKYIRFIAEQLRLPDVYECVPCGHPPLYYALAALWSELVLIGGWLPLELGLQWFSLLLFFGFVVFSLLIFRSAALQPVTLRLAAALIVFWPSSIIDSVRVHNDALASLSMLAAIYFMAEWDRRGQTRDFHAALVASALALLTKSSGYAVATTLLFFTVLRLYSTGPRREGIARCATAIVVLAGAAVLAVGFRESRRPLTLCQKVLGHACDGRYQPPIPDTASRFLSFDALEFVRRLDTVPEDPFLNRLAKSSLFGFKALGDEFGSEYHQALAAVISVLFLVMVAACLASLPWTRRARFREYRAYVGAVVVMVAFLVAFRIRAPNGHHEAFRHISPVLVPFCLAYVTSIEKLGRVSRVLYWLGVAVALSMVLASVAFFVRVP